MPGTLVLDSEGLSRLYRRDRAVVTFVEAARLEGARVATTTMTLLEADDGRVHRAHIAWALSRIDVHPITRAVSDTAGALLRDNGLRGHKHAIDAVLAAVARAAPGPVTVVTSDLDDLTALCGKSIAVVPV
jgi:hypothetical protein